MFGGGDAVFQQHSAVADDEAGVDGDLIQNGAAVEAAPSGVHRESAAVGYEVADGVQIPLRDGIIRRGQSAVKIDGQ